MNKKFLVVALLIFILLSSYVFVSSLHDNSNAVNSMYGFTFTPPNEYRLWEGVSASMDVGFKDLDLNTIELQDFISSWQPEASRVLVFTTANVEISTRELSTILAYADERVSDPLTNDPVVIVYNDRGVDFDAVPIENERMTRGYLSLGGKIVQYNRIKGFVTYHVVSVNMPLENNSSLTLIRQVPVDADDEEIKLLFGSFLQQIQLHPSFNILNTLY